MCVCVRVCVPACVHVCACVGVWSDDDDNCIGCFSDGTGLI